jgi:K(+)-stimulated pyrophosphate-energized sodium pump
VLIGTAVVGATTMIFSIIMVLTDKLTTNLDKLSMLHAPFLLGLIMGGAVIYWFTGASMQAVSTGAYRAVEFIKANIKLEGAEKASASRTRRRSSRSARSTRRRACSTSSSRSSSARSPSPSSSRSSSSAT